MAQQQRLSPNLMGSARPVATVWIGSAFCVALGLAALVLVALGPEERGTIAALQVSARFSFLLFWLTYSAGAMTTLFGPVFEPLKRRGRELGLAFASAHLVHIALVVWLTHIGHAPSRGVFVFFGIAVLWTYLLALFSIPRLQRELGAKGWWFLRVVGLNYIAYAFAKDFLQHPQFDSFRYLAGYLPFAVLSVVGPLLRFIAFASYAIGLHRPPSTPAPRPLSHTN
ncbi:hypothetical protein [Bradyrhizobium sp.]|uniref:hypothetical protein n=1 Tax=Bradyrhizobium sp. TaxID=376 RepID=UPI003C5DFC8E